jgi:hypothetical protein
VETCAEAADVSTWALTFADPLELAFVLTEAEAAGVETLVDAFVSLTFVSTLACVDTTGVETFDVADADDELVCAVVDADADATGVLTLTLALAEVDVDAVTLAVPVLIAGAPGRPSA